MYVDKTSGDMRYSSKYTVACFWRVFVCIHRILMQQLNAANVVVCHFLFRMDIAATAVTLIRQLNQIVLLHHHPLVCPGGKGHHKQHMAQTKMEDNNGVNTQVSPLLTTPLVALLYLSNHLVHPINHYRVRVNHH